MRTRAASRVLQPGTLFLMVWSAWMAFSPEALAVEEKVRPKFGPAGAPLAVPLSLDHAYFQNPRNQAPDFWALMPFYVPQFNDYSCSTAAVSMVVNGVIRTSTDLKDSDKNVTQDELLGRVKSTHWRARVHRGGYMGQVGLTVAALREALAESMKAYAVQNFEVEQAVVQSAGPDVLREWRRILAENEKSAKDLLLIHFLQDGVTMSSGGPYPHISPVGAYDESKRRVLILDVDRTFYQPYWVGDEAVLKAMAAKTAQLGHGGYVRLILK